MPDSAVIGLILRLLGEPPDPAPAADAEMWKAVRDGVGRTGLAALTAYAARAYVSPAERAWCDQTLMNNWRLYAANLANLEFLLERFEAAGVRAVALKGPCLAVRFYQPPFLRKASVDLDFAVGETDFQRACEVLREARYEPLVEEAEALEFSHHAVFMHAERPRVELHFRLTHGARGMPVEEFLERAVSYRLPSGRETWILAPEDEILQLALHVASSRFAPFFHLYELHRICAAAPQGAVERAAERAAKKKFSGAMWMIDAAFRHHWGEPFLPPERMPARPWLHWRLNKNLYLAFDEWSNLGGQHTLRSRLRGRWLDLQTSDTPADAWRQLKLLARYAGLQMLRKGWRTVPVGGVRPGVSPSAKQFRQSSSDRNP